MEKYCILDEERACVDCGDCMACDIDPEKRCDNCMQCVKKSSADYLAIEIDEVIASVSDDEANQFEKTISPQTTGKSCVRGVRPRRARKNISGALGKPK